MAIVSACGSTLSANTSYIRNPGYPASYTPTSVGTCTYTINKANDDVCQLRLDFITFSGYTHTTGVCSDTFAAAGQTGVNPPSICGTNNGYHMYIEFGTSASDSITLTNTWSATGIATAKNYNILARQICCTDSWKAPTGCTQYFTGLSGNVQSYGFAGGQLLAGMNYQNCIRTEDGYCGIEWKQSSTTTPDPFGIGVTVPAISIENVACPPINAYISIPNLSPDGIKPIPVPHGVTTYINTMCGGDFGIQGPAALNTQVQPLVSRTKPFTLNLFSTAATNQPIATGFNLDYTQQTCI